MDKFWQNVSKRENGCWIWTGKRLDGYGFLKIKRRTAKAHRVAYELMVGPIPKGQCVCHHCDNPLCCNPGHLFIGTQLDNIQDRVTKGRSRGGSNKGTENPAAKLNASAVEWIRENSGRVFQKDMAKRFGVCQANVSAIVTGKTWRLL